METAASTIHSQSAFHVPTFQSLDEAYVWCLSVLFESGIPASPRHLSTLESSPVTFCLRDPRRRCITNPIRKWNLPFAVGEFCWHASGSDDLSFIEHYSSVWRQFSEDGHRIRGSCYGHKIFELRPEGKSQWDLLKECLNRDPHSRRAILPLIDASEASNALAKDVACATAIQFLIRDNALDAFVTMRSNDAIWGLPYDVFFFTMMQELLAAELCLPVGRYFHYATSLHLYERHFALAEAILNGKFVDFAMPKMSAIDQLGEFLMAEQRIRCELPEQRSIHLEKYWKDLLTVLEIGKDRHQRLSHRNPDFTYKIFFD